MGAQLYWGSWLCQWREAPAKSYPDPSYHQVHPLCHQVDPEYHSQLTLNEYLFGAPVNMLKERNRLLCGYFCTIIGHHPFMIVKRWAAGEAKAFCAEMRFWLSSIMGEEKPSVPWVLEDYETSQVVNWTNKILFKNKQKRNNSQLTYFTNISVL